VIDFGPIKYLDWLIDAVESASYDLASSGLKGTPTDDEGVIPDQLAELPDPDPETDLVELIAATYDVAPDRVLPTAGASIANVVAVCTAISAADIESAPIDTEGFGEAPRVLIEKPGYEPLVATPRSLDVVVDRFRRPPEDDYRLSPDRVGGAVTGAVALVSLTNRHNPSGQLADRETLAAVAERVRECDARLLVDEVYAPFAPDPYDGPLGGVTAVGIDGAVVTGSLTKFHGLGGLRVGWLIADPEFVERARTVAIHFPALADPGRALGRRTLYNRDTLGERSRELLSRNADLLAKFVDARDDLHGPVFDGNTYAFLDYEHADGDEIAAEARARDLAVAPGRFFDDGDRFRVSLGREPEHVREALGVLDETLDVLD